MLWNYLIYDLVTYNMPLAEKITGIRILDKTRFESTQFRFQVWTEFPNEEHTKPLRDYIDGLVNLFEKY